MSNVQLSARCQQMKQANQKSVLTLTPSLTYSAAPRRGFEVARGASRRGNSKLILARRTGASLRPKDLRNHVDRVPPPVREGVDPAAVGIGTEASHPLRYTPRRAASASSPLKRLLRVRPHASVIASNRSRKGDCVLCPPGTCAFLGAFFVR
jgi:hypothetical protein